MWWTVEERAKKLEVRANILTGLQLFYTVYSSSSDDAEPEKTLGQ